MSNLATKAPNFTKENAKEMSRRGAEARRIKREREKAILAKAAADEKAATKPNDDDSRRKRTLMQIDLLDGMIDKALEACDSDKFLKLSAAKERLWKLVSPTAGVLRPKRAGEASRRPSIAPVAVEIPAETPQAQAAPVEPPAS